MTTDPLGRALDSLGFAGAPRAVRELVRAEILAPPISARRPDGEALTRALWLARVLEAATALAPREVPTDAGTDALAPASA